MSYKSYYTDINNVEQTLDLYGVAVIPNILSNTEINNMQTSMWDILKTLADIDKNDTATWKKFYNLFPLHSMLLQHYSVGHHQSIWDIRQNLNVVKVFAKLWNTEPADLLTSFDGCSIHLPPEITGRGWYKGNNWLHTDQSFTRNNKECIQGFVTAFDIKEGDACLTILEGSHNYHKDLAADFEITDKQDWFKLTDAHKEYYNSKGCDQYCVLAPAGSLVLWDSRTIHCGREAMKTRTEANFRFVAYVCQTPRALATKTQLTKKQKAFNDMRLTAHWPHKIKLFPKYPRTYGNSLPVVGKIAAPVLTDLGKKLAGF